MWRPAVSRFGAMMSLAFVACWSGKSPDSTAPLAMQLEPASPDIVGPYWCSIDHDGYDYPRYACMIKKVGGRLVLAKLGGSQRVRGDITLEGKGFTFDGELYCPWGDCTEPMRGKFISNNRGGYTGELFNPAQRDGTDEEITNMLTLHLMPAPQNAFGGQGYGGDGYGDPFGGSSYGGYGYGRRRPSRMRP